MTWNIWEKEESGESMSLMIRYYSLKESSSFYLLVSSRGLVWLMYFLI